MTTLTAPNLDRLPAPEIISVMDFETVFNEIKAELIRLDPSLANALEMESEPMTKLAQVLAYRILHERKLANDQAHGLMLATATGAQLDHLGALPFIGTSRHIISPENPTTNPTTPATYESDADYRKRLQMAFEGYTTAGSIGSYIFHGLAADADVKSISVTAPKFTANTTGNQITLTIADSVGLTDPLPGDVAITVLSRTGNGAAPQATLEAVGKALNGESIRPITDRPRIRSAEIVEYQIDANIYFDSNAPDQAAIMAAAQNSIKAHVGEMHEIGRDISISAIHAAIHQTGIHRVEVARPASDITINDRQSAYCTSINLVNSGVDQ